MIPKLRFKADDGSEFPEWEEKRLGEVFVERSERSTDNLDLLSVTIANGVIRQNESDKRNVSSVDKSNYKRVYVGDLAYNSMRMWQGAEGVSAYDGIVSPAYTVLVPKKQEYAYFYEYMFKRTEMLHVFQRYSQGLTSDTWNLKYPVLAHISVVVPSLPEQQKIASFLSTIDEIIQSTESELTAWQERKKGVMQKIFNREVRFKADDGSEFPEWEERRIDSFANCYAGATPSTKVAEYWQNGSIPWMSSGEVNNREIYETEKKISELGYEKSSTKMIKPNTVVIALAGQGKTRGMVAIARISVCTNQSLCAIETNDMVNDDYLYQYLITQYDNLRRISSGDGTRGGLNLQLVGEYKVFLPVLHEQRKIADCLSSLDDVISQIQAELSAWKEFKKGLLQQMFV